MYSSSITKNMISKPETNKTVDLKYTLFIKRKLQKLRMYVYFTF